MLQKLRTLFTTTDRREVHEPRALQLAAAALMIELSKADFERDPREQAAVVEAIRTTFQLDDSTIDEVLVDAESANAAATSLYEFTRIINDRCDEEEKFLLVRELWRVAFVDGNVDKYESHLIRKIAELVYLPHALYIKAKMEAAPH